MPKIIIDIPKVDYVGIVKRLNDGTTLHEIAEEFNVTTARMKRKMKNVGFMYDQKAREWKYNLYW